MFNDHRESLGFSLEIDRKTHYYVFNILPFGISTAGYIFTKVLREPVKYLRAKGIKIISFLDVGIRAKFSFERAKSVSTYVKQHFKKRFLVC